jgi:hypothetical protein
MGDDYRFQSQVENGLQLVKKTYSDGGEVIEGWDIASDALQYRRSRRPRTVGGFTEWDTECGEFHRPVSQSSSSDTIAPSSTLNPQFVASETKSHLVFRVRNLVQHSSSDFSVFVDSDKDEIVIRTSTKKFYKRFPVPQLRRLKVPLDDELLSFSFEGSSQLGTLVIQYKKPRRVLDADTKERGLRAEHRKQPAT